jgi:predicted ATPase
MPFMKSLKLSGLLSFPPDSPPIELTPLNILIGPNGSGKSNFIEGLGLLNSLPTDFAAAIRAGDGIREWLWKGQSPSDGAEIESIIEQKAPEIDLRYRLNFSASGQRTEITDEIFEEVIPRSPDKPIVHFYNRLQEGWPTKLNDTLGLPGVRTPQIEADKSILSQVKDIHQYPALTYLGIAFSRIGFFREWSFGRNSIVRQPQRADLPSDILSPDSNNLALILNELEHSDAWQVFNELLTRFFPRFRRFSTRIIGGTVQFYLHEQGLSDPIPASRLSDGTIRFLAMLALLLSPTPPSVLCMEEPELGLHPDAVCLLADLLVEASSRMQIVVTTHSDALVSALTEHADSVLVCEHRGGTVMNRVESEKLKHWLDQYRLGEIWRIGELGGNP